MISNYKCTFGSKEGKSTSVTQKQNAKCNVPPITRFREQYRGYCSPIYRHRAQPVYNYIYALYNRLQ
jgi:hypothetical protein